MKNHNESTESAHTVSARPDPIHKAFEINLNRRIYGVFSEIGAGQEVARYFFRAGGASGTIAKSMSAYDMAISDDIYGKADRYVSRQRVQTMVDKEFHQLQKRLDATCGESTCFFSFANTVAAKSYQYKSECHGWLGMAFQHRPRASVGRVLLHVRMLDKDNLQQQEALGIVGTNLIYSCTYCAGDRARFVQTLMDNLSPERLKIDFIEVQGPAFDQGDPRLWPLELVKRSYCEAIMFGPQGTHLQPKDALYKKNILVCRGSYRPPTLLNLDMLKRGHEMFQSLMPKKEWGDILTLPEISMNQLRERGEVDSQDFLARIELLGALKYPVLISSFETYARLSSYLSQCTKQHLAFVMGHYNLSEVFNRDKYQQLAGGMLEGIGTLMGHRGRVFVYPAAGQEEGQILGIRQAELPEEVWPLIDYLQRGQLFLDLKNFDAGVLPIWSRTVLRMIQNGESGWETMVPPLVAQTVKKRRLFDYSRKSE